MDARVEVAPACATAQAVQPRVISILVIAGTTLPRVAVTSTRVLRLGKTSLTAVPAPISYVGGYLAHAA